MDERLKLSYTMGSHNNFVFKLAPQESNLKHLTYIKRGIPLDSQLC